MGKLYEMWIFLSIKLLHKRGRSLCTNIKDIPTNEYKDTEHLCMARIICFIDTQHMCIMFIAYL